MTDRSIPDRRPYAPPEHYFSPRTRMQQPHRIRLNPAWLFSAESYERLCMGHEAQGDSDLWNCYVDPNTDMLHVHRATVGYEIYRMPLDITDDPDAPYRAPKLVVEKDLARYQPTDMQDRPANDQVITSSFVVLLKNVLQAPPIGP